MNPLEKRTIGTTDLQVTRIGLTPDRRIDMDALLAAAARPVRLTLISSSQQMVINFTVPTDASNWQPG